MQTLKSWQDEFIKRLDTHYPTEEIDSLFYIVVTEILNMSRLQIQMNMHLSVNDVQAHKISAVITSLRQQIPIQHILGHAPFYGWEFEVNEHTLIPRPETEELVHLILHQQRDKQNLRILDVGTGSGCIAISLAKALPHAVVSAIDISRDALAVAKRNAAKLQASVNFTETDMLTWRTWNGEKPTYDVIVSNPPYITPYEKAEMSAQVLDHEPHRALFVTQEDPLIFYREIAVFAAAHLSYTGALYFEINQYLAEETKSIVAAQGFAHVQILDDINGAKRMLYCQK